MTRETKLGWDVQSLNKAYRHGYMAASMGMELGRCPYRSEVVVAAWEAGWEDATEDAREQLPASDDLFSWIA
ncbi:hypothetical protein EHN06_03150 [Marinobacter sp. NP-4(2019)]|uniref:ribosome modulation factor n=1 Tax=Marinobacter sp. NP-4(2019) TaxID=2488665 RepID=UPI000FC3DD76|nr:ribosome modulation factor [Marinobacter sp. NP-4(2019)]AZT82618.1 hypothetical protein EHN06_03150 [Marinobacter sp. NP-4(2019)]